VVGLQAARHGADVYLVDRVKGQWDFTETCRQLLALRQRYSKTGTILIEEAANGSAIINVLSRQVPGVIAVTPDGGKYARAQAAQPMLEAGNIWLPKPRPYGRLLPEREWVEDFLHQLCVFPTGAHETMSMRSRNSWRAASSLNTRNGSLGRKVATREGRPAPDQRGRRP
jgi:predicted phage terminase large subunit-like protein